MLNVIAHIVNNGFYYHITKMIKSIISNYVFSFVFKQLIKNKDTKQFGIYYVLIITYTVINAMINLLKSLHNYMILKTNDCHMLDNFYHNF